MRVLSIFCICMAFHSFSVALPQQDSETDSLTALLHTLPENKDKVLTMSLLSELQIGHNDSLSILYAKQTLALARRLSYDNGIGRAFDNLAKIEKAKSNYSTAITYFDSALVYFEKSEQYRSQGIVLNELGIMNVHLSQFDQARAHFIASQDIFAGQGDSAKLAQALSNIGLTYDYQGMHSSALNYYFKCLAIDEKLNDEWGVASDYTSIGITLKRQNELSESEKYYTKALEIYRRSKDEYGIAQVLGNLGVLYKDQNKLDQALDVQQQALATMDRLGNEQGRIISLHNIAVIYYESHDYALALQMAEQSNALASGSGNRISGVANNLLLAKIHLKQDHVDHALAIAQRTLTEIKELRLLEEHHEITALMAEAYKVNGEYRLAVDMLENSKTLSDSIYNLARTRQMQELRTQYETTKKEGEIALLNHEKLTQASELKTKTLIQNITLIVVVVIGLLAFFLFRSFRSRQKYKRALLDQQLSQEKMEAERLYELDQAKSRFFANIAHEFRTPLTLILGPAQQILEHQTDQKTVENTHLIRDNADKLLLLVNQLLDLIKLESGMIKLHPAKADFIAFLKGCVHSFESLAEEKDIKIHMDSEFDAVSMDFDPEKLAIVFSNLMSNALKFTAPFGTVNVIVKKGELEKALCIEIEDNGIGVPSDQLPFIFDRFYQVDDSPKRRTQGTGIGLALVKELVELHQGSIEVCSEKNSGTQFIIRMPMEQDGAVAEIPPKIEEAGVYERHWTPDPLDVADLSEVTQDKVKALEPETVLVVEDNADVRKFIVNILDGAYQVLEAENGKVGLEMAVELIPDLVISDVMMPEMDGYEFCRQAKEDVRTSHIPVIMLTAKAGLESKIEGLDVGADDYLAKPFNARELLARIKNLVGIRKRLHEKFNTSQNAEVFSKKENVFITRLKKVIEENIDKEDFNVVDLGKALAMSRTQVHRKLKALTNLSTSQFIRQYKLNKALEILRDAEHNVSEVAYMLGFNTPNYFSTCFTDQFGFPPSEVNRQVQS